MTFEEFKKSSNFKKCTKNCGKCYYFFPQGEKDGECGWCQNPKIDKCENPYIDASMTCDEFDEK